MITLAKIDKSVNIDLESIKARVKELKEIVKCVDFKESHLSLKEYLEKKENETNLSLESAFNKMLKLCDFRESTIKSYKDRFKNHIITYFGNANIKDVNKVERVRAWIEKMQSDKKEQRYSYTYFKLLTKILNFAMNRLRAIDSNVCRMIDFKESSYIKGVFIKNKSLSENELKALLNCDKQVKCGRFQTIHIKESLYYQIILFVVYTCLRVGNVINLRWNQVDFDKKVINIDSSEMKNKKPFELPLNSGALQILNEMQKVKCDKYVFSDKLLENRIYHRKLKELSKKIDSNGNVKKQARLLASKYNVNYSSLLSHYYGYKFKGRKFTKQTFIMTTWNFANKHLGIYPHVLRNTFSTILNSRFDIDSKYVDICLSHSNYLKGSEASYNGYNFFKHKKKVMEAWGAYVDSLKDSNKQRMKYISNDSLMVDLANNKSFVDFVNEVDSIESDNDTLSF
ncbi:tyrosine-type recombinase/integrase [Helicobacter saguini]|uniref:Tyrosine-type recombinase/integrase n=1 Tax=Helicobacter saguini TaxID=1548018 RepID=A0A099B9K4_9HELI|nr:site-specific integrase [Helicobacter saguini]MWV62820.1 tyrosine-type recombinase/integrase [Helicobacter saguini]MWV66511.1 tyrosine-type recombinase/integrase [Helicobacter saguini]MWV68860.1 tyrosine-type recombinase/integrase [Helicobacter saguini]MWV71585.1 tyrosine-type recombinase/integrase [Helicobacter saguini]TLD94391.1 hypothetical protein LS64_005515 [Helicobacter saguini]